MAVTVYDLLCGRYNPTEYVIMAEVSDKAGFGRSRSADFIVVGLWPSRGLPVIGIELKSFRGDWLKEKKSPEKAENIYQYCDFFFLLTTDESIAKIEEIPLTWGWLCIKGDRIKVMKEAPYLTAKPLSKDFVVCMLRRAADKSKWVQIESIQNKIDAARAEEKKFAEDRKILEQQHLIKLKKEIKDFEDSAGIRWGGWESKPKKIGEAVKFLADGGVYGMIEQLKRFEKGAEEIAIKIKDVLSKEEIPENISE